ncbi:S8 family serine peptidase [Halorussus pelagicus]|uniref:S8 family serine peptidase n=1 Tax=Halorussus pelagicus TaxID=2505977 RepID=UPI000FFC62FE|nr:S8 family serine peptidase [Halorussus pelagicus]
MTDDRLSAIVFSVLLVVSAATAAVPAAAVTSAGSLSVGNTAGNTSGNTPTTTLTETTTTAGNTATTTVVETTTTADNTATTTLTETTTTTTVDDTSNETTGQQTLPVPKSDPKVSSSLLTRVESSERGPSAQSVGGTEFVQVVVRATPGRSDDVAGLVGTNGGDVQVRHENLVQARVPAAAVQALADSGAVEFVRQPQKAFTTDVTSAGLENMDVGNVHDANYTGDNVTVAVVDLGFDVTNPEISDQLVNWRNFSSPDSPRTMANESGLHGTGTAELVADTAPNASIVAAKVNYPLELYEAIDWIRENTSADVVSMSVGWYNVGPLDGTAEMNREIGESVDSGTPWVISAGNEANGGHWNGTWSDRDDNQWMNFDGLDERMNVTPAGGSGSVQMAISWDDWSASDEDYDAILVNESNEIVASSSNVQNGTQRPTEYISHYASENVYLRLWNADANGSADFDVFFGGSADPEYDTDARSITVPATGPRAITVGAVHYSNNELEGFSSRGPTIDGRLKPDVVAPDGVPTDVYPDGFYGTSAAAPHTAGVVGLMLDADRTLTPAEVKSRLQSSATPLRRTEPNNETGYGLVDADGAIPSVEETSPNHVEYAGTVLDADGNPSTDDGVYADDTTSESSHLAVTNSSGNFSVAGIDSRTRYSVGYFQDWNATTVFPQDGTADIYVLDDVNATEDVNVGSRTVPDASLLDVQVVDEDGNPVPEASVSVTHHRLGASTGLGNLSMNSQGYITPGEGRGIEMTGNVTVEVTPPDNGLYVNQTYTRDLDVTSDTDLTVTLEDDAVSYSGQIRETDGDPAVNDDVVAAQRAGRDKFSTTTDDTGNFSVRAADENLAYAIRYYQGDRDQHGSEFMPRDGSPDLYTVDLVNGTNSTDIGNTTLPEAHVLNVSVVDASGDPVPNVTVYVGHVRSEDGIGAGTGFFTPTGENGAISPGDAPGIEVLGDVTARVHAPDSDRFVDQIYSRNFRDLSSDANVTFRLQEKVDVSGQVNAPDGNPVNESFVSFDSPSSSRFLYDYTNADGGFTVSDVYTGQPYSATFFQGFGSDDNPYPHDGVPDVYALDSVNATADADLGQLDLPNASMLNVRVVDEVGRPVENASVDITHHHANATALFAFTPTDAEGYMTPRRTGRRGMEFAGNVSLAVSPPENSTRFPNQTQNKSFTLTDDRNVTVTLETPEPTISAFDVTAIGQDTDVTFVSSEQLSNVTVGLGGDASGTLTRADFTENESGPYIYRANVSEGQDGTFEATLLDAEDADGNEGASGQTDSVTVDLNAPTLSVNLTDATDGNGVVNDGDEVRIEATVTDNGSDIDAVTADATELAAGSVTLAHASGDTYAATVTVADAGNGTQNVTVTATDGNENANSESGSVVADNAGANIPYFNLQSFVNQENELELTFNSDEKLKATRLTLSDGDGNVVKNVTRLSTDKSLDSYEYNTTFTVSSDGRYRATLEEATDAAGNENFTGTTTDTTTVDTTAPTVSNFSAEMYPGSVRVSFESSEDLDTSAIAVELINGSGQTASTVTSFYKLSGTYRAQHDIPSGLDETWTANLTRAEDNHGNDGADGQTDTTPADTTAPNISDLDATLDDETVTVTFDSDEPLNQTLTTVTVTNANQSEVATLESFEVSGSYTYTATYEVQSRVEESHTVELTSVSDRYWNGATYDPVANVEVDTRAPTVANFDVVADGQNVDVVLDTDEDLSELNVSLGGDADGTLSLAAFDETYDSASNLYTYRANVSAGRDGTFEATLRNATDDDGNVRVRGQTDSVTVDVTAPTLSVNLTDATDGDGVVNDGDEVRIETTATDSDTGVDSVTADATGLGAGSVTLAHASGDTYAATVTVADAGNGTRTVTVTATDGNENANSEDDSVVADNEAPHIRQLDISSYDSEKSVEISLVTEEELDTLRLSLAESDGNVLKSLEKNDMAVRDVSVGYKYQFSNVTDNDGTYRATLEEATDAAGNENFTGATTDTTTVDTTAPTISNFSAKMYPGSVRVSLDSSEELNTSALAVELTDASGQTVGTVSSFSRYGETYYAQYDVSSGLDETWTATLTRAEDDDGNDGADGQTDTTPADTTAPNISDLDATFADEMVTVTFDSDEPLNQTLTTVTVTNANQSEVATLESFEVSGSYTYTATYEVQSRVEESHTVELTSVSDRYWNGATYDPVANVEVDTRAPTVANFDVVADGQNVDVVLDTDEDLSELNVSLGGDADGTLSLAAFDETYDSASNLYTYRANVSAGRGGTFEATLRNATDDDGNVRVRGQTDSVFVDVTAPTVNTRLVSVGTTNGWHTSAVEVNVSAFDATSGVAETEYRVGGDWQTYDGNVTMSADGRHTVEYRSTDEVGNAETGSVSFKIDTFTPTTSLTTNVTENRRGWYTSDVNVTLSAVERPGGLNATKYRLNGSEQWTEYDESEGIELTTDGEYTVEFYSVDEAGNRETTQSETIKIDTQKPTVSGTHLSNRTEILPEHGVPVTVNATDNIGVAEIEVGGDRIGTDGDGFAQAASPLGNHTFEVVVRDAAGNEKVVQTAEYSVGQNVEMSETANDTLAAETNDTNVNEVSIETKTDTGEANVTVGTATTNPDPERTVTNGTSLYFPQIDTSVSNDNIGNATVTVTVEQSRVRQRYITPGTVKFWVEEENESTGWEKVDAERVDASETDGTYTYEIEAPHFSTYAITGEQESTPPTASLAVATDDLTPGDVTLSGSYADDYSGVDPANVTLRFEGENGGEDVTSEATVTDGEVSFTRNLSAGSYEAALVVTDDAGNSLPEPETVSFTVANESSVGSDGGSSGGGGGGGGGAVDIPVPDVRDDVTDLSPSGFRGKILSARSDSPGRLSPEGGVSAGDLTVRRVSIRPSSEDPVSEFYVDASVAASAPGGAGAPDVPTLGYVEVATTDLSASALERAGVKFSVPASAAAAPENVALYRLSGESWEAVETEVVETGGGQYVLRGTAASTGTFAVGVRSGALSVTDASVGATSVEPGERVEVTATVENDGSGTASDTAAVSVDGEVVAEKSVELAGGESKRLTFEVALDLPGERELAVDGESAGLVSVADNGTDAGSGDADGTASETTDGGSGSIPGFGVSTALAALLAGLVAARRRLD